MKFNVPTNTLDIGSIDLNFHTEPATGAVGDLTSEQWAALLAVISPLVPPPLGTKQV